MPKILTAKFQETEELNELYARLRHHDPHSSEYSATLDQIVKLRKLQSDIQAKQRPSPDQLIAAGVNIVVIGMILHHEQFNVVTSKALSFVPKMR